MRSSRSHPKPPPTHGVENASGQPVTEGDRESADNEPGDVDEPGSTGRPGRPLRVVHCPVNTAGVPWRGRTLAPQPFTGDEGGADATLAGALADLRKAVELFPEFHEALALEAQILLARQEPDAALASIKKALDARPDYVDGYVIRARCVYATSLSMQAFMEDLDVARKLDPQDSQALTVQRMLKVQRLGPRELGCRFEYETAHYRITSDISEEATKRYGDNLEAAWRHYAATFKGAPPRAGAKPRVSIFMTAENYYTYFELLSEDRGENTLGVFRPNLNELVLFEKASDLADTNHTLYHEAVHQFMTLMTSRTPPYWYNEGVAEYMGAIKIQNGKVVEKWLVLNRLALMQYALEVKAELAFEKIMNETPGEFYGTGNVFLKYAQAWSMVHFFYEFEKGKYQPLIEKYFELLRAGKTPRECYDTVFKGKDETLQKEWRDFTKGLKAPRPE